MISSDIVSSVYSGAGNTFTFISPIQDHQFSEDEIVATCRENDTDGLIYLSAQDAGDADFYMHFFNRDGSRPGLCGNGLRCTKAYLSDMGYSQDVYKVATPSGTYTLQNEGENFFSLFYPEPKIVKHLSLEGFETVLIDTGILHLVVPIEEGLEKLDVHTLGKCLRHKEELAPGGANINFLSMHDNQGIHRLRTFELGVEAETLACGSGALASSYFLYHKTNRHGEIGIQTQSGELLKHLFIWDDPWNPERIESIKQTGPAGKPAPI